MANQYYRNGIPYLLIFPVESLVHKNQAAYYQALQDSTAQTDSAPFIIFMLDKIEDAINDFLTGCKLAMQVTAQVNEQLVALPQCDATPALLHHCRTHAIIRLSSPRIIPQNLPKTGIGARFSRHVNSRKPNSLNKNTGRCKEQKHKVGANPCVRPWQTRHDH